MLNYPLPTSETAPEGSRATLAAVEKAWGFAPNLMRTFANSPAVVQGAWAILGAFEQTTFSSAEKQLLMIAVSVENSCEYCTAAHSLMAKGAGLSDAQIDAVRASQPLDQPKLEALRLFTTKVVATRGFVSKADTDAFLSAGYNPQQVLEVVLGVTAKTLMNYTDHLADVALDDAFKSQAWTAAARKAA